MGVRVWVRVNGRVGGVQAVPQGSGGRGVGRGGSVEYRGMEGGEGGQDRRAEMRYVCCVGKKKPQTLYGKKPQGCKVRFSPLYLFPFLGYSTAYSDIYHRMRQFSISFQKKSSVLICKQCRYFHEHQIIFSLLLVF